MSMQSVKTMKIWRQSDPSEALITTKLQDNWFDSVFFFSLYMRDNKYVQHPLRPLAPAWAVLNSKHLIVLASMIPKDQKYITTLKWRTGQLFMKYFNKKSKQLNCIQYKVHKDTW
jgi:hypothetical protein